MTTYTPGNYRARSIFAASAWATLGLVVLGGFLSLPILAEAIAASAVSRWGFLFNVLPTTGAVILLALWGSAVWYAWTDTAPPIPRGILLALLVAGNFVAAFFYYFGFDLWVTRAHTPSTPQSIGKR